MNNQQKEDSATLEILQVIENQKDITQRHLADRLDVALGLANSYLKRCVRKGLIKIHQAPANRYFYYLTPKGFAEKSRLTAEYLSSSFDFYRQASNSISNVFEECEQKAFKKILLIGYSELAEIATLRVNYHELSLVGLVDPGYENNSFFGLPVFSDLIDKNKFDVCLLTSIKDSNFFYKKLNDHISPNNILVPSILGIN